MTPRARRALFSLILFFAVCAVVGTFLQGRVGAQSSTDESQLRDSLKTFTNVYSIVEQNYAEPITGDKADDAIYDGAIPGMLQVLDPHSTFYDPKAYAMHARRAARPLLRRRHDHPAAGQQGLRHLPPTRERLRSAPASTPAT